jgi:quercetin dioxygenase-like cupin family protein
MCGQRHITTISSSGKRDIDRGIIRERRLRIAHLGTQGEKSMKIKKYTDIKPTHFDNGPAHGVAARVVIGKADGANNFCMRVFEIAPGGHTPKHSHDWEHEMFVHSGTGEVFGNGQWNSVRFGNILFIPSNEEHQIRNSGKESLTIVCLVPSHAPEL